MKKDLVILETTIVDDSSEFTITELCTLSSATPDLIQQIMELGIIEPKRAIRDEIIFSGKALQRLQSLMRLQHDLEINLAGAALALDLLEEIEMLRAKIAAFEKHFSR
jgi:chaperone modulatory protein CbpM